MCDYRIQFDGHYVKECDYEYLVECKEAESVFSERTAQAIQKQCSDRVKIFKIITKEYMDEKAKERQNDNSINDNSSGSCAKNFEV